MESSIDKPSAREQNLSIMRHLSNQKASSVPNEPPRSLKLRGIDAGTTMLSMIHGQWPYLFGPPFRRFLCETVTPLFQYDSGSAIDLSGAVDRSCYRWMNSRLKFALSSFGPWRVPAHRRDASPTTPAAAARFA